MRILAYIAAGDIYQANLTARFLSDTPVGLCPFDICAKLRRHNPAPFAAYLGCGPGSAVASASPERFISLHRTGRIESRRARNPRHGDHHRIGGSPARSLSRMPQSRMLP
jgi:para-aminobenzoate synthetase component 1